MPLPLPETASRLGDGTSTGSARLLFLFLPFETQKTEYQEFYRSFLPGIRKFPAQGSSLNLFSLLPSQRWLRVICKRIVPSPCLPPEEGNPIDLSPPF